MYVCGEEIELSAKCDYRPELKDRKRTVANEGDSSAPDSRNASRRLRRLLRRGEVIQHRNGNGGVKKHEMEKGVLGVNGLFYRPVASKYVLTWIG